MGGQSGERLGEMGRVQKGILSSEMAFFTVLAVSMEEVNPSSQKVYNVGPIGLSTFRSTTSDVLLTDLIKSLL